MAPQLRGRDLAIVVVFATVAGIATILSGLRVYVRLRLTKARRAGYEDLAAGIGWLLFMFITGLAIAGAFYGTGQHISRIPSQDLVMALKMTWMYDISYLVTNMVVKQSISLMLWRFAVQDYHRKLICIVTFALQLISIIVFFTVVYECIPVTFFWTRAAGDIEGLCRASNIGVNISYVYSTALVVYDVTMAFLPWLIVRRLQLDLRTRLMVTTVLALGSTASIATIARIPFVVQLAKGIDDFLYNHSLVMMVSCAEIGLSIAASSAATLRPLFRKAESRSSSNKADRGPLLATIRSTPGRSSAGSNARKCDIELSTAFHGGAASTR